MANPINGVGLRAALRSSRQIRCLRDTPGAAVNQFPHNIQVPRQCLSESSQTGLRQLRTFTSTSRTAAREQRRRQGDESSLESKDLRLVQDPAFDKIVDEADLGSMAHAELEVHRELREMARLAAWDMPLLARHASPWEAPDRKKLPLRWRYTTYLGEAHPAASKVVVEFGVDTLPDLDSSQKAKLMRLAGARYNPQQRSVKMSSESFETQAQNKRYLADTINKLIAEARSKETDHILETPLDTRHHKPRKHLQFPAHWMVTEERRAELAQIRSQELLLEQQEKEPDRLLIGQAVIAAAMQAQPEKVAEPVMQRARRK